MPTGPRSTSVPSRSAAGSKIGPESDIYGLGSTMYHMVTRKVHFEGRSPSQVMHRHLKDDLVPPDHVNSKLSAGTAQIIEMMLEKRPSDRYGSASDLIQDIDLVLEGKRPLHAGSRIDLSTVAKSLSQDETVPPGWWSRETIDRRRVAAGNPIPRSRFWW